MDHIPRPDVCFVDIELVPYLGLTVNGCKEFTAGLAKMGIDEQALLSGSWGNHTQEYIMSCLQEWLYFGLLAEVSHSYGVPLNLQAFIKVKDDGSRWITALPIIAYTNQIIMSMSYNPSGHAWHGREPGRGIEHFGHSQQLRLVTCLTRAKEFLEAFHFPIEDHELIPIQVLLSLNVMTEVLLKTATMTIETSITTYNESFTYTPGLTSFLRRRLFQRGWCPRYVDTMVFPSIQLLYFAQLLPSHDFESHIGCSALKCLKMAKSHEKYSQRHEADTCPCTCQSFAVSESHVVDIIKGGGIPVICNKSWCSQNIGTEVEQAKPHAYIAISHVWYVMLNSHSDDQDRESIPRSVLSQTGHRG